MKFYCILLFNPRIVKYSHDSFKVTVLREKEVNRSVIFSCDLFQFRLTAVFNVSKTHKQYLPSFIYLGRKHLTIHFAHNRWASPESHVLTWFRWDTDLRLSPCLEIQCRLYNKRVLKRYYIVNLREVESVLYRFRLNSVDLKVKWKRL